MVARTSGPVIHLLGRFEVRAGDRVVLDESWRRRGKAKALLKLLALQPGRSLHREQAMDVLWPELGPEAAAGNFRKNFSYLRQAVEQELAFSRLVQANGDAISLSPDVSVDIDDFRRKAAKARSSRTDPSAYEDALGHYAGDLLPEDLYAEWTHPQREELRGLRCQLLLEAAMLQEAVGAPGLAIELLETLLGVDAVHEEAHRLLMQVFATSGKRDRAIRQYEQCRAMLNAELDVEPSTETEELYQQIVERRTLRRRPSTGQGAGTFVAREVELDELRSHLDHSLTGRARFAFLIGEPGIGKTRTADEIAAYARLRGARVYWGRCYDSEGTPAYWPWIQVLRSCVRDLDDTELVKDTGNGASALSTIAVEIAQRMPDLTRLPDADPGQARFHLFDSVSSFLANTARRRPVVVILDDLHAADEPSLKLLEFLALHLRQAPLFVLGTYRAEEVGTDHPLNAALGEVSREDGARIRLVGLTEEEVGRFVEQTAGIAPSTALAAAVREKTEGNPFFVSEVVRLLASEGQLGGSEQLTVRDIHVPLTVRDVVRRRMTVLSEECRRVLAVASLIGREFSVSTLEAVSELPRSSLMETLEEAEEIKTITEAEAPGRYSFAHALVRDTLYDELPTARRVSLHGRVGEALEHIYGADLEPHLAELAYHFVEAASGGYAEKALDYATRAGEQAALILAFEEAAVQYENALRVMELKPADDYRRAELFLLLGEVRWASADGKRGKAAFLSAAEIARGLGAQELLDRAAYGAAGLAGLELGRRIGERELSLLEEATGGDGRDGAGPACMLLSRLAIALYNRAANAEFGEDHSQLFQRAATISRQAEELARTTHDNDALATALLAKRRTLAGPDGLTERFGIADEVIRLGSHCKDPTFVNQGRMSRLSDLLHAGQIPEADTEMDTFLRATGKLRAIPLVKWRESLFRATRALLEGRWAAAEEFAEEARNLGQGFDDETASVQFAAQLLILRREQGRISEMEGIYVDLSRVTSLAVFRSALALIASERGHRDAASEQFELLAANKFSKILRNDPNFVATLGHLSEVCVFLNDRMRADLLYDLLAPYADRNVMTFGIAACNGSVSRYLGLLAAAMNRWDVAERHYGQALQMHENMGARPWLIRTQYNYAGMLAARGQARDRDEANTLLSKALTTADELEMTRLIQDLRAAKRGLSA